jgi:ethanolamine utilization protein EutQ (cupin superfamily)
VKQVIAIDMNRGNSFWKDVIKEKMKKVLPAFEFRDDDVMSPGFKKMDGHMVFNVKLDLVRKAQIVACRHQTDPPMELVYTSNVFRDSVCLAFLIAALNDLEILSADVKNAYLNAPTKEKIYMIAGRRVGR